MLNEPEWLFTQITDNIKVSVIPVFYPEGSSREQSMYIWIYTIRIENLSNAVIQIIGRHWQIYDEHGKIEEVKGNGVVGQQPIIRPGEIFEYTSQVRLFSESGLMKGEYYAVNLLLNSFFNIEIPAFSLDSSIDKTHMN
jgi:ApaG protein